jgi:formylglycine-generating enzyme
MRSIPSRRRAGIRERSDQVNVVKVPLLFAVLFTATLPCGRVGWTQEPMPKAVKNSVNMQLVPLPAGRFRMGQGKEAVDVTLSRPFMIGRTEVTQGQWKKVMGTEPWKQAKRYFKEGANYPATFVSWASAKVFCEKLNALEQRAGGLASGTEYGLPTEAQWEYACRAGTTTHFACGDNATCLNDHAWWGGLFGDGNTQSEPYPHEVATKKPNAWGLYDMHGNAYEWCSDCYGGPFKGGTDPVGPQEGGMPVVRGGAWHSHPALCRCGFRDLDFPDANVLIGFRVVRTIP